MPDTRNEMRGKHVQDPEERKIRKVLKGLKTLYETNHRDIAKYLGVSTQTYSWIECGTQHVRHNHVSKICEYYDISISDFYQFTENYQSLINLQPKWRKRKMTDDSFRAEKVLVSHYINKPDPNNLNKLITIINYIHSDGDNFVFKTDKDGAQLFTPGQAEVFVKRLQNMEQFSKLNYLLEPVE